ncbi:OLC1v1019803C1 [Oldenlandia corymbosa var. corymbosa]|uniref:OLC1v1019803C1 n=1 Tax=Oldenlandia corymbosa var. corymbosa TaxID=529605 RepID=A0AAV1EET6_OLDCO|nr:OLC1v1019803C1 [Oldenlandia corymbosa var. corymbosa]
METSVLPLNLCHVQKKLLILNRFYMFIHSSALLALIHYRVFGLREMMAKNEGMRLNVLVPYVLVFAAELMLCFLWLVNQGYRWRPVSREVFPERLPEDDKLPAIDVFICTADPSKEPSVEVMNTVISAMALDYPPEKLNVYLSDDGGSAVTLKAMIEAWKFARFWLPFCRKYGIKNRCPEAYFSSLDDDESNRIEFTSDKEKIEKQYEKFKERVEWIKENTSMATSKDHPARVEVINLMADSDPVDAGETMPLAVYVSREKNPSHPHHFKAGALNTLIRVSGMLSNSPYVLVLDCDMYCSNPSSARQAMCFHLDPNKSPQLAWVQFPQKFHNISDKDIYDSQIRFAFKTYWPGKDGVGGPTISGTGFYLAREALYGLANANDADLGELRKMFGPSPEFIRTALRENSSNNHVRNGEKLSTSLLQETQLLASCTFEKNSQWGKEVGFRYFSVVEDYFTGFSLHCKGHISVYFQPSKPAFLGSATTNLSEFLVQNTRWCTGLIEVALSKYSPLFYGPPRMSFLQSLCYADLAYFPFFWLPYWCLAIVPQLCLIRGISLYPAISSPYFIPFVFIFISANLKHLQEVISSGLTIKSWIYEQRMWMIKSVTCYTYGTINTIMEKFGMKEASFLPTNKADDEAQIKLYQSGVYDFRVATMFMAPICTLIILNLASLFLGGVEIFRGRNFDAMAVQAFISMFIVTVQYPVIEGMFFRKDIGRVQQSAIVLSASLALAILALGAILLPSGF